MSKRCYLGWWRHVITDAQLATLPRSTRPAGPLPWQHRLLLLLLLLAPAAHPARPDPLCAAAAPTALGLTAARRPALPLNQAQCCPRAPSQAACCPAWCTCGQTRAAACRQSLSRHLHLPPAPAASALAAAFAAATAAAGCATAAARRRPPACQHATARCGTPAP